MNVGMVFGMIFSIIIIGFVLYFGYTYIGEYMGIQSDAGLMQQILSIDSTTSEIYNMAYESSRSFTVSMSSGSGKLCFVDTDNPSANPDGGWPDSEILRKMVTSYENNVLILDSGGMYKEGKKIDHLVPYRRENFCVSSPTRLILMNEGDHVSVRIDEG